MGGPEYQIRSIRKGAHGLCEDKRLGGREHTRLSSPPSCEIRAVPGQVGQEDIEVVRKSAHLRRVAHLRVARESQAFDVQEDSGSEKRLRGGHPDLYGRVRRARGILLLEGEGL